MDIILERTIALLVESGKSQKELAEYLDISKNVFTDWKSGRLKSYKRYVHGIADYFGVSVEYLKGETDIKNKPTAEGEPICGTVVHRNGQKRTFNIPNEKMDLVMAFLEELETKTDPKI